MRANHQAMRYVRLGLALVGLLIPVMTVPAPAQVTLDQQIELKIRDYKFVKTKVGPFVQGFQRRLS